MNTSIDGFYAVYLTTTVGQGFAMTVFRQGIIVGIDVAGVKYDGAYSAVEGGGFEVKLTVSVPPNSLLIQGTRTGPEWDIHELLFQMPEEFWTLPFLRIADKHGPVNAKLVRLRELNG
jgi:hypothetical protein